MIAQLLATIRSLVRCQAANAAVEFAILAPILMFLLIGTIDLGLGFQQKIKLQSALNSGMQHVMQTQGADIAMTRQVIAYGLAETSAVDIEVAAICTCGAATIACSASCASGRSRFVTGSASLPYKTSIFEFDMNLAANFRLYVGQDE